VSTNIDQAVVEAVTRRIVERFDPEKVVLFGSRARGDAREDSDYDILIVAPSDKPRWKRTGPVYQCLVDIPIHTEVFWWTDAEIDDWSEVGSHFITRATNEGKVLYEKEPIRSCKNADETCAQ